MRSNLTKVIATIAFMAALAVAAGSVAEACSRYLWNSNKLGVFSTRSMDWAHSFEDVLLIIPRGAQMDGGVGAGSAKWTSKYGSVVQTVYPYAKKHGFTIDDGAAEGINEKGLTVHMLYLETTQYAEPDDKPGVSYLRWGRFLLDNYATVAEAVEGMKTIRITPVKFGSEVLGIHVAVEDPSGDSAIFELIDGKLVVHHGREFTVMTNDPPYDWQLVNLKQYQTLGGLHSMPGGIEGADRFVRLAYYGQFLPEPADDSQAAGYIMSLIHNVAVPFGAPYGGRAGSGEYPTWWTAVVDLDNRILYFNWTANPNTLWVDLNLIDFAQVKEIRMFDPKDPAAAGEVSAAFAPVQAE
jgi:choloylglycine hydrolase